MPFATRRPGSSFVSVSARSVPAIVSPIVPPICWKNVRLAVAMPTERASTLFWTSAAKSANDGPMPSPATTIHTHSIGRSVSARRFVIRNSPTARMSIDAEDQQLVAAGPRDDLPADRRADDQREDERQEVQTGLGGAHAAHDLEPLRQEDDRAEEARTPPGTSTATEIVKVRSRNRLQPDDRVVRARLPPHEHAGDHERRATISPPTQGSVHSSVRLLRQADEERHERGRRTGAAPT